MASIDDPAAMLDIQALSHIDAYTGASNQRPPDWRWKLVAAGRRLKMRPLDLAARRAPPVNGNRSLRDDFVYGLATYLGREETRRAHIRAGRKVPIEMRVMGWERPIREAIRYRAANIGDPQQDILQGLICADARPEVIQAATGFYGPEGAAFLRVYEALYFDVRDRAMIPTFMVSQILNYRYDMSLPTNTHIMRYVGLVNRLHDTSDGRTPERDGRMVLHWNALETTAEGREARTRIFNTVVMQDVTHRALKGDFLHMKVVGETLSAAMNVRKIEADLELKNESLKADSLGRTQQQMAEGLGLALRNVADVVFPEGIEVQAQDRARLDMARGVEARRKLAAAERDKRGDDRDSRPDGGQPVQ